MSQYQSILPDFDVFRSPGPVREPRGGQMLGVAPRRAASFVMNPGMAAMRGLGQDEPTTAPSLCIPGRTLDPSTGKCVDMVAPAPEKLPVWMAVAILGAVGYLSYEIGSAMTPSGGKRTSWGIVGIPVGLFTGPLGLGLMAIASNHTSIGRRG